MTTFHQEILEQPAALRELVDFYRRNDSRRLLSEIPRPERVLLTGMGASYHAGLYASYVLQAVGIPAIAIESANLIHFSSVLLTDFETIIFISQSGASGEVMPLLNRIPKTGSLIALTNHPQSPLGIGARRVLPLIAGKETTVATKTYVNSLACLWLLAQVWSGVSIDIALNTLLHLTASMEKLFARGQERSAKVWIDQLAQARQLLFLGHGPHAVTARQTAMMLGEWPKRLALSSGIGAFRHGIIEIVQSETSAVVFGLDGATRESTWALAAQMQEQGARVLLVVDGDHYTTEEADAAKSAFGDFLAPLLDVIPAQFFAEALALHENRTPGFRYISKVVTNL